MNEIDNIKQGLLEDLEDRFFNIPFENSSFQNKKFVIDAQQTPARAYRSIGLKMFAKIQAIKELRFVRELEDIDIEEYECVISREDSFKARKAKIEIKKILANRNHQDKLLNDSIAELNFLNSELEKLPRYTRETFEAEEAKHFEKRLTLQIKSKGNGSIESLYYLNSIDPFRLEGSIDCTSVNRVDYTRIDRP